MKEKGRKGILGTEPLFKESLKIAVARDYLNGQLSYSQIARKYNLPKGDTARYFVKWYKEWLEKQKDVPVIIEQQKDIELSDKLKQANLRITALEMLIKNAEEELGIDLIKKFGSKQRDK